MKKIQFSALIAFYLMLFAVELIAKESTCYGSTKDGRLDNGVQLPSKGVNFVSYGKVPEILGRTYVHSTVYKIVIDAYYMLEQELPGRVFKYAETGYQQGRQFKPHKTHQNGLSIDFMVPVLDENGKSLHLPTNPLNKYGYNISFDDKGNFENYRIDYTALAAHIVALHKSALKYKVNLWRVLFAPELQPYLYSTSYGDYIKQNITIPNKKSWVRHDEHYHVDFDVKCKQM